MWELELSSELCSGLPELSSREFGIALVLSLFSKTLLYSIYYSFSTLLSLYFVQYYTSCSIVVAYLVIELLYTRL